MEHKFDFDGQAVVYRSGTVRDREVRKLVLRKLYAACGGIENVPELEQEIMWDYANFLVHTSPFEADWRREPGATPEQLYEGYEAFANAPAEVYDVFRVAARNAEMPEKKKLTSSAKKSTLKPS